MEKFFNQSKEISQKPTGDSGFFSEQESVLTNSEKRKQLVLKLAEAQTGFNDINSKINNLLGDYKNNFADKISDEQKLLELSESLESAQSFIKTLRHEIDHINQGEKYLHDSLQNEVVKN